MNRRQSMLTVIGMSVTLMMTANLSAQTVQLPSFSRFGYSGTVWVPTRGATSLGGVSRSSRYQFRRPGSVARGQQMSRGNASVHVTIIDNDAIDREIRGLPPRGSIAANKTLPAVAKKSTKRSSVDPDAEGKSLVRFARRQYLGGNRVRSYEAYSIAIETLSPKLAEIAKAERSRVFASSRRRF